MDLDRLIGPFQTREFLLGLRFGVVALGMGLLVGVAWRWWRDEPAPVAGALFAAAALAGLAAVRPVPLSGLAGLGLLALAGLTFHHTSRIPLLPALLAVPGALLLVFDTGLPGPAWVLWMAFGAMVAGTPLTASFDGHHDDPPLAPLLFAVTVAGVFATVPDTEEARLLLGVVAPVALLAWPLRLTILGATGSHLAVALLLWAAVWGGRGRSASVIGAVGCLAVLAIEPVSRSLRRFPGDLRLPAWILVGLHLLLVAVASRVAGLRSDPVEAGLIIGGGLLLATVSMLLPWQVFRKPLPSPPRHRPPSV